jgi:hypothetical protein
MAEGLQKTIQQISSLMVLPDADLQFLQGLQEAIATYIQQGGQSSQGGNVTMPAGPGMPGGGPPMGGEPPMMAGPGMGGMQPPNPDELRRAMQMSQG